MSALIGLASIAALFLSAPALAEPAPTQPPFVSGDPPTSVATPKIAGDSKDTGY